VEFFFEPQIDSFYLHFVFRAFLVGLPSTTCWEREFFQFPNCMVLSTSVKCATSPDKIACADLAATPSSLQEPWTWAEAALRLPLFPTIHRMFHRATSFLIHTRTRQALPSQRAIFGFSRKIRACHVLCVTCLWAQP